MKPKINLTLAVILFVCLSIFGCKETATKEAPTEEATQAQVEETKADPMPDFNTALDPLVVGKEFSKVLSDTLNVQLYEVTIQPGDSIRLHQHLAHAVYILEGVQ